MIDIPTLNWLLQKQGKDYTTNVYIGSLGTSPTAGCISKAIFNYKILVIFDESNNHPYFQAGCYIALLSPLSHPQHFCKQLPNPIRKHVRTRYNYLKFTQQRR